MYKGLFKGIPYHRSKMMLFVLRLAVLFCSISPSFLNASLLFSRSASSQSFVSHSQASQDAFVYSLLYELENKQDQGYYLELGSGHPVNSNNTLSFEKDLGWQGVSIDASSFFRDIWQSARQNPLLIEDATRSDYAAILSSFPRDIDYLSLDVDNVCDAVLRKLPLDRYFFKIITIQHDAYRIGDKLRYDEREILESFGYRLLCSDISSSGCAFEDWWIYPGAFREDVVRSLGSLDLQAKDHKEAVRIIRGQSLKH